ncbi:Endonuclease/exonuclease/phosphatase [Chaetomium sp. MPI-SDFR-AT-0129]|nr:Endonuclease/exonuclease/phosphatase [Chaetomium sp. MPI-SDFR-AT-0129]
MQGAVISLSFSLPMYFAASAGSSNMALFSRFRTQVLSWWQDAPLPPNTTAKFQTWHEFDNAQNQWRAFQTTPEEATQLHTIDHGNNSTVSDAEPSLLNLVTWNVDYSSPHAAKRITSILSHIFSLTPASDVIFLQEVSRDAYLTLLVSPDIRRNWLLSDADGLLPTNQQFMTITLLSKATFGASLNPGPVWRVPYPSRFGRDALCADIFLPSHTHHSNRHPTENPNLAMHNRQDHRVRLINVHLDSLPIQPSQRPKQIAIAAELLRAAGGRGLVAGDFNPVLPSDAGLVEENGLRDAWTELHPGQSGFTWGVDGTEPFPPNRMDKVVTVGVEVRGIEVLTMGVVDRDSGTGGDGGEGSGRVAWSDHSGLRCSLSLGS